jgi:hypothetical protein
MKTDLKKTKKPIPGHWWLTPAILDTQKQRSGGSQFKDSPGK